MEHKTLIKEEKLSLNLMLRYPVHWDDYKICRDYLQNFYDARPGGRWMEDFSCTYDEDRECITLHMDHNSFSYEWLTMIGASTKGEGGHAGYFGEGFKIASLCAFRDMDWQIEMISRDWELKVDTQDILIDNTTEKELIYHIRQFKEEVSYSELRLYNTNAKHYDVMQNAMYNFYYPENILFGELLFDDGVVSVHRRSDVPYPDTLPMTTEWKNRGIMFCDYQIAGTIPIPFIIAYHEYKRIDRERNTIYRAEILDIFYKITHNISPETAAELLYSLKPYWNLTPRKNVDVKTWYYVVCQLVRQVSYDGEVVGEFREKYPDLLYVERIYGQDYYKKNRRKIARTWMKQQPVKYTIVQEVFWRLGYKNLEELCEESGGFLDDTIPTEEEQGYIEILYELTDAILPCFFDKFSIDNHRVIRNDNAPVGGLACMKSLGKSHDNPYGFKIRYRLKELQLKYNCLNQKSFDIALSTYLHERAHIFGGDKTDSFSLALTKIMEVMISQMDKIMVYRQKWENANI